MNIITHATNQIDYLKLIYADRYDTDQPQFHSYYSGELNTWKECEYSWHENIESLINEVNQVVEQYGESNVTLDYIAWRGVFRILIAVKD